MDGISREQKLELVRQIKTQYHQNKYDLYNREHLLYATPETSQDSTKNNTSESLKFRSVVAILLFLFVILLDSFGFKPLGIEMTQLFGILQTDYLESISDWQAPL